ncbi:MAG: hypothetical protein H6673_10710 [Anaerolineales bacterium]|nr:hypothetical protein [Anaerolineales bacterium]
MSELKNRLIFSQLSHKGNGPDPLHTHAISTVAAGFGDGQRRDFGLFILTQGYSENPSMAVKGAAMVSRAIANEVIQKFYYPVLSQDLNLPPLADTFTKTVTDTDHYLSTKLGNTAVALTAAVVIDGQLYLVHTGNNRAYLTNGDKLQQLTKDHSSATPTADELRQMVGYGNVQIDFSTHQLPANAKIMICNSGVWQVIASEEIAAVLSNYGTPESATQALDALFEERDNGNVTAILIQKPYAN